MKTLRAPQDCQSMAELRDQIDAIDVELIALLAIRVLPIMPDKLAPEAD